MRFLASQCDDNVVGENIDTYLLLGTTAHAGPWPLVQLQPTLLYSQPYFSIF
jgi:hypothetical protein